MMMRCTALALLLGLGGCSEAFVEEKPSSASPAAVTAQAQTSGGCAEHDHGEDGLEVRARAAKSVSWKSGEHPGPNRTFTARVLGFNDFHGQLSEGRRVANRPVGGAAVLGAYLKHAAADFAGRSFIVHAGDHVGASPPESALLQDEPSIQFLNLLANEHCRGAQSLDPRCNVVGTPGNHEFDEGKDELLRLVYGGDHPRGPFLEEPYRGADFPYVSANVVDAARGRTLLPPYVFRSMGDVKIGVIGAVLRETPSIVTPSGVAGLTFLDEATAINEQVALMKSWGIRSIIVTLHQGGSQRSYSGPTNAAEAQVVGPITGIVSQLDSEVDVVVSGHFHQFTNALVPNAAGHPILVTQAFSSGTAYAEIDLELDRWTADVVSKSARIVTTFADEGPGLTRDPEIAALVADAQERTAPLVNRVITTIGADITRATTASGESTLGSLIADAQRSSGGTDFAFMNPGGIRTDLAFAAQATSPADSDGAVLWGELFAVQPFANDLVTMTLTGQQVYDLLNQQWQLEPNGLERERFLQISGLEYTFDRSRPLGDRVVEVRRGGVALDRSASFSVTVNSFIAAGGDNFTVLSQGANRSVGAVDLDALIAYLQAQAAPIAPPALGRISSL